MIGWLSLLLSATADAEQGALQRARLHELAGRLGIGQVDSLSQLQKRLLWVLRTHEPEVAIRTVDFVVNHLATFPRGSVESLDMKWIRHDVGVVTQLDNASLATAEDAVTYIAQTVRDNDYYSGVDLSQRHRVAVHVPWIAQRMAAWSLRWPSALEAAKASMAVDMSYIRREDLERKHRQLSGILDFAEATNTDLSGRTWRSVLIESNRWHRQLAEQAALQAVKPGDVLHTTESGYTLHELGRRELLVQEGVALGHCVGTSPGYWQGVARGSRRILSLRDPQGKPVLTIELERRGDAWRPRQIRGKANRLAGLSRGATGVMQGRTYRYSHMDRQGNIYLKHRDTSKPKVLTIDTSETDPLVESLEQALGTGAVLVALRRPDALAHMAVRYECPHCLFLRHHCLCD